MSEAGGVEVNAAAVLDAPVNRDADAAALYCPDETATRRQAARGPLPGAASERRRFEAAQCHDFGDRPRP